MVSIALWPQSADDYDTRLIVNIGVWPAGCSHISRPGEPRRAIFFGADGH